MGYLKTSWSAFKWGFGTNIKKPWRCILLLFLFVIIPGALISTAVILSMFYFEQSLIWIPPLIILLALASVISNSISFGAFIKIFRGEEPNLSNLKKTFIIGVEALIIVIAYEILPACVLILLHKVFPFFGTIIGLLLAVVFGLYALPAGLRFMRTGRISAAFDLENIKSMIHALTWRKYIFAWVAFIFFNLLTFIVFEGIPELFNFIPEIGASVSIILSEAILLFTAVPLFCFELKFWYDVFIEIPHEFS